MTKSSRTRRLSPLLAALVLAACSRGAEEQPAPTPPPASEATAPSPDPIGGTVGGDGSAIELQVLTAEDLNAETLPGELACSFARADDGVLLLVRGDVASGEAAVGVVKVSGYVERVAAPGGFDAMLEGASFAGQGKTVAVEVTGQATGGGESPPRPATLTYQRADGASRVFDGLWTCGP
ncbi:hypothetical protein [Phenylobacterium sp.]|uniref:hypothetical protein n=1 Tax=Phenylobacterium sp. TaxID=1871053 RepID=UPI0027322BD6|nr:hypothetical protein [Phenylobacterium sp.]MDP1874176.1 hypothetical protein [Phenylobacterium sp.]MDP3299501.1 hypothetical protein [Phenylobacterium sp.]